MSWLLPPTRHVKHLEAEIQRLHSEIAQLKDAHAKEIKGFREYISRLIDRLAAQAGVPPISMARVGDPGFTEDEGDIFADVDELREQRGMKRKEEDAAIPYL